MSSQWIQLITNPFDTAYPSYAAMKFPTAPFSVVSSRKQEAGERGRRKAVGRTRRLPCPTLPYVREPLQIPRIPAPQLTLTCRVASRPPRSSPRPALSRPRPRQSREAQKSGEETVTWTASNSPSKVKHWETTLPLTLGNHFTPEGRFSKKIRLKK